MYRLIVVLVPAIAEAFLIYVTSLASIAIVLIILFVCHSVKKLHLFSFCKNLTCFLLVPVSIWNDFILIMLEVVLLIKNLA